MSEAVPLGDAGPDDLTVAVTGARAERFAAVPTLQFRVELADRAGGQVHAVALRAQIRIEPQRRRYADAEKARLFELFGPPAGWGRSLRPFLWSEISTVVPAFVGATEVEVPIACSYDFEVSAHRFLHSLDDGEVPLLFLFSGTAFRVRSERLAVLPIPWHTECRFGLAVSDWRGAVDQHFPGGGWLRLDRDTIDAVGRVKAQACLPTWDATLQLLVDRFEAPT